MTRKLLWALLCSVLLASQSLAQIAIEKEFLPFAPIVAKLNAQIPEGATIDGGWSVEGEGVQFIAANNSMAFIWAPPCSLDAKKKIVPHKVTYRGAWVKTEDVVIKQADGTDKTIKAFVGFGFVNYEATFIVAGSVPQPDPPQPDPQPIAGPWQILFFYDGQQLDNLPMAQRELMLSRETHARLAAKGHKVLGQVERAAIESGSVPAKWTVWVNAAKGDTLPRIAIAPKNGGPVQDFPLPADEAALLKLLDNPKEAK